MATRANSSSQNRSSNGSGGDTDSKLRSLVGFVEYLYKAVFTLTCILFTLWFLTVPIMFKMYMDVNRAVAICKSKEK